jgi:hypothetical protein
MMFTLNVTAWLALELCDGRRGRSLESSFRRTLAGRLPEIDARAELQRIVEDLEANGMVERFVANTCPAVDCSKSQSKRSKAK